MNDIIKSVALGAIVVTIAALVLKSAASGAAKSAVGVVANVNEGTPFEGFGPIGTLGNAADTLSFGLLSKLGGAIGRGLFTVFGRGVDGE